MRGITGTLLFALLVSGAVRVGAATRTAASCNAADVQAAMNSAGAGDTVLIPAGTCRWTTRVTWNAPSNVSLIGAGNLSVLGGGDATVIVDDFASSSGLLSITVNAAGTFRMAGLTIQGGSGSLKPAGIVGIGGGPVRLDHLHISTQTYSPLRNIPVIWFGDKIIGVLDHSIIDLNGVSALYFFNGEGTFGTGDVAWASPTAFGTSNFLFIEDNRFNGMPAGPSRMGDCFSGSRVVWRFNTFTGVAGMESHATGHAPDGRGCRAQEAYGNHFAVLAGQEPVYDLVDMSGGTAMVWGNVADANAVRYPVLFNVTRKNNATYAQGATPNGWGYCGTSFNGTGSNWDGNTDASTGYPCIDQPGRGQGDLLTGRMPSRVNSRTGTIAWPNQALEPIYFAMNTVVPHPGYGGAFYNGNVGGRVVADRDYYAQASGIQTTSTSPFNGTTGTGWGTRTNRPTTCTTGVGYFATDQGAWNTSSTNPQGVQQNGADGVLDVCTATNTWTNGFYTPYAYPHPLTQGQTQSPGSAGPAAPTSLRIVGS